MDTILINELYLPQQAFSGYHAEPNNLIYTTWLMQHDSYPVYSFLRTRLVTDHANWKCKHCKKKISEPKQIQTSESHVPIYHVKCYMELHQLVMQQINRHKIMLESQLELIQVDKNE